MRKKTTYFTFDKVETTLQKGTVLEGSLKFERPLKICGKFTGDIESGNILYVAEGADVAADINARIVIVNGRVNGNITASEKVEIQASGQVKGNLKAPMVKIADGVVFEGKCQMIRDPETIDIFSARVEKLKEIARNV
jgi:cytoskeletal protein CcmA (bactofilin family)